VGVEGIVVRMAHKRKRQDMKLPEDAEEAVLFKMRTSVITPDEPEKIEIPPTVETVEEELEEEEFQGFQSLGSYKEEDQKKKKERSTTMPSWMKDKINIDDSKNTPLSSFSKMLDPVLVKNIQKMDISSFFPVQTDVIPYILSKRPFGGDICVCAPTGSGKTLTYAVPIIQVMANSVLFLMVFQASAFSSSGATASNYSSANSRFDYTSQGSFRQTH
jgi:hypothetical protein